MTDLFSKLNFGICHAKDLTAAVFLMEIIVVNHSYTVFLKFSPFFNTLRIIFWVMPKQLEADRNQIGLMNALSPLDLQKNLNFQKSNIYLDSNYYEL